MNFDKLTKRIEDMLEYENDDYLININLKDEVSEKLFDYQIVHVFNLMTALRNYNIVLDGSDTGTGKTYAAAALCKQLNIRPLVVCPKIMISKWYEVLGYYKVNPLTVVNYEMIKSGKTYTKDGDIINCRYIDVEDKVYRWKVPRHGIIIFDEVHKCKNKNSQNGRLLLSTKSNGRRYQTKIIMLSATVSDTPKSFAVFGYMLGFYKRIGQAKNWINGMLREDANYIGKNPRKSSIHSAIYPFKGSRITVDELGDKFPKNQISADCYKLDKDDEEEVNRAFDTIDYKTKVLESTSNIDEYRENILTDIVKARQKIELLKISIIKELTDEYLGNDYSVVIFVNFVKTVKMLSKVLKTRCIVYGGLDVEIINRNIESFQRNDERIIICTSAKAIGISLHDLHGVPRVSIINPVLSGISYKQILGRIYRAGSKTPALQRLIFCANTCEQVFCRQIKDKLDFLDKIND